MPPIALRVVALAVVVLVASRDAAAQSAAPARGPIAGQAIAVSRSGQGWGIGYATGRERWETLLRAAQQAMQQCNRPDCRVQLQSINPNDRCAAFARGARSYGIGVGPDAEAARRDALRSCTTITTGCRIVDERCPP